MAMDGNIMLGKINFDSRNSKGEREVALKRKIYGAFSPREETDHRRNIQSRPNIC